jgi:hypothetical protein
MFIEQDELDKMIHHLTDLHLGHFLYTIVDKVVKYDFAGGT